MPEYQGNYVGVAPLGYAGMIADTQFTTVFSRAITVAIAGFGLAVGRGATDGTARINGAGFEGITVADKTKVNANYAIGDMAGVMAKGSVWVIASTAVTPADPVTFTAATGVIGAGLVTAIPNARFLNTAAIGGLVQVFMG